MLESSKESNKFAGVWKSWYFGFTFPKCSVKVLLGNGCNKEKSKY